VIQSCNGFRLTAKPGDSIWIGGEFLGQDFERHLAIEVGVVGAPHLTHTAAAERRRDAIRPDRCSCLDCHSEEILSQF
jgi:hypothetical protein